MEIVGKEGILENPETGEVFSSGFNRIPPMRPRFKVKPRTVEDVQKIVRWANQTRTPLVPVSSGEPHLKSDTVPQEPETVIVDLSGMSKILKIDRRYRRIEKIWQSEASLQFRLVKEFSFQCREMSVLI